MKLVGGMLCLVGCLLVALTLWGGRAGQAAYVPTPTRPPILPVATPVAALPGGPVGGFIELDIQAVELHQFWTIIQWQDRLGGWHDVDGWQGRPDGHRVVWWVAPSDLGQGPFRWLVYAGRGGALLTVSETFDLPRQAGERVEIQVSIRSPRGPAGSPGPRTPQCSRDCHSR
jgi:hypothetical protein